MAENFAEGFVDYRNVGLAPQAVTEFPFYHGECGFDIGPLVIVCHKVVAPELEVVKHLPPSSASPALVLRSESDIWNGSHTLYHLRVAAAGITFVRRDFGHSEILSSGREQRGKHLGVTSILPVDFNGSHDIGFDSAHDVNLYPILLDPLLAVLHVKPASESASCKSRRIGGEISLYCTQRQTALSNQIAEYRSQFGIFKVIGNAIAVRHFGDVAPIVSFPQIAHKAALRDCGIYLERDVENGIGQRQSGATVLGGRYGETGAQIGKQCEEFVLLVSLRFIVGRPVLRVGSFFGRGERHALCDCGCAVRICFLLYLHNARGNNVLARLTATRKIRALARRKLLGQLHAVQLVSRLRRNPSPSIAFTDCPRFCQFHARSCLRSITSSLT